MKNIALITGITGQDGSFLAEFLLGKGYEVHGTIRRSSVDFRERIAHLEGQPHFHLHYADMGDSMSLIQVVSKVRPTEIYNLAAQSHVQVSFDSPEFTADVDATGVLRVLEAVRQCGLADTCRIYQASTSELYGKVEEVPQNENTPFHPYSPYAVAKLYGYWIVKDTLEVEGVNIACVSGSFPSSQALLEVKTIETALAIKDGADEIDMVMPVGKFLQGDYEGVSDEIQEMKAVCGDHALKVILETGDLVTASNIKKASILAMYAGADYIKTSTGKEKISATPEAAYVMCQAVPY